MSANSPLTHIELCASKLANVPDGDKHPCHCDDETFRIRGCQCGGV